MTTLLHPPVLRLIGHSPVVILPPPNLKLNPSPIANFPFLNALLMQAVKDSNGGKHIARQRKMWVEGGRGEWQYTGVLQG